MLREDVRVVGRRREAADVHVPVLIVVLEGQDQVGRQRYLEEVVLASIPILVYDRAAAEWHAGERVRLVAKGQTPSFIDGQIAAIAQINDLILITSNESDFRRFRGLRIQNWM